MLKSASFFSLNACESKTEDRSGQIRDVTLISREVETSSKTVQKPFKIKPQNHKIKITQFHNSTLDQVYFFCTNLNY